MEIKQQFVVDQPIATVWDALCDIRRVASCVPGAEIVSVSDDGTEVEGKIRTKVGPISAAFAGKGIISRDDATHTGQVEGSGADRNSSSRVKMTMVYTAVESDGGKSTTTDIVAKVVLTGPLAQFSKGSLMNDIAAALTAEFTKNLRATFGAPAVAESGNTGPAPAAAPAELRPLKLFWNVLKTRLARLFG